MTGILRRPTGQVTVGGRQFVFDDLEITLSRTKKGDTFRAKGALSANDLNFLLTTTDNSASASINGAQLFTGVVDHSDYDFDDGCVTVSGRDKGSAMIDSQTSEKWLNRKPSDIVQDIASRHGLRADVDTAADDAGKMFSSDWDAISHRFSDWTWVNRLADQFGMVAYITGGTLYFKQEPEQLPVYTILYRPPMPASYASGSFCRLKVSRNHILGRPVKVNARSHHHRDKQVYTATVQSDGPEGIGGSSSEPLIYNMTIPLARQEQLDRIASKKLYEVQSHELKLEELEIPGDETITARTSFQLTGTGTILDQTYEGESVHHHLSFKDGFRTKIVCKDKKKKGG